MLSFTSIATTALTLTSVALAQSDYNRQNLTGTTCPSGIQIIYGGGCAIPCHQGDLRQITNVTAAIRGVAPGYNEWQVGYDYVKTQAQESTPWMIGNSTAFFAKCPNTPVVYLGYSLGGIIVGNMACGAIGPNHPQVIALITLGSELYSGDKSWDYPQPGACAVDAPSYTRSAITACSTYGSAFREYCNPNDKQCCKTGTSADAHFAYDQYADDIGSFVANQYRSYTSSQSANSTSATATTSITATASSSNTATDSTNTGSSNTATSPTNTQSTATVTTPPVVTHTTVVTTTRKACPANYGKH